MTLKLSDWASIAEIVSGVAIVATLVILLLEVRTNTAAVRAATYQNVADSITTTLAARGTDPDVARVWLAGDAGDELEPLDEFRFDVLVTANMRRFESAFYQYQIGGIEESQWQGIEYVLSRVIRSPGHRHWWPRAKSSYSLEFQELVEELLNAEE